MLLEVMVGGCVVDGGIEVLKRESLEGWSIYVWLEEIYRGEKVCLVQIKLYTVSVR